jgi:hypothetical protein
MKFGIGCAYPYQVQWKLGFDVKRRERGVFMATLFDFK